MCRLLNVSPSGFYRWQTRKISSRQQHNQALVEKITEIHRHSDAVYGSPRVHEQLLDQGERCRLNRVARLMRECHLQGIPRRRRRRAKPGRPPNLVQDHLQRDFSADQPNQKWVTDITQVQTQEGWLYLAIVLDLSHRVIVGWSMDASMQQGLVIQAVAMALMQKPTNRLVILHSDWGSQYTSQAYQDDLQAHQITLSMGAVGSCYDNAMAESFFGLLKRERTNRRQYRTRREARQDIFDYIERFYNPDKLRKLKRQMNVLN